MSKMSKNGQICYFQHFLGVQWNKLPQSTGLPWKTLTPKILPNFVLVFYIYCHYAISVWDFKIHRDGHNHGGQHRSPEFLGGSSDWGPVDSGCHKLSENMWSHVLGPLHFIWWIEANYKPSTHQELCYLNFDLTKWVQEKNCQNC